LGSAQRPVSSVCTDHLGMGAECSAQSRHPSSSSSESESNQNEPILHQAVAIAEGVDDHDDEPDDGPGPDDTDFSLSSITDQLFALVIGSEPPSDAAPAAMPPPDAHNQAEAAPEKEDSQAVLYLYANKYYTYPVKQVDGLRRRAAALSGAGCAFQDSFGAHHWSLEISARPSCDAGAPEGGQDFSFGNPHGKDNRTIHGQICRHRPREAGIGYKFKEASFLGTTTEDWTEISAVLLQLYTDEFFQGYDRYERNCLHFTHALQAQVLGSDCLGVWPFRGTVLGGALYGRRKQTPTAQAECEAVAFEIDRPSSASSTRTPSSGAASLSSLTDSDGGVELPMGFRDRTTFESETMGWSAWPRGTKRSPLRIVLFITARDREKLVEARQLATEALATAAEDYGLAVCKEGVCLSVGTPLAQTIKDSLAAEDAYAKLHESISQVFDVTDEWCMRGPAAPAKEDFQPFQRQKGRLRDPEEDSSDPLAVVGDILRSSDAKTKWITYCMANGMRFDLQPDQYDLAFLRRFLDFHRTGLSMAQEPELAGAVAAAWGGAEKEIEQSCNDDREVAMDVAKMERAKAKAPAGNTSSAAVAVGAEDVAMPSSGRADSEGSPSKPGMSDSASAVQEAEEGKTDSSPSHSRSAGTVSFGSTELINPDTQVPQTPQRQPPVDVDDRLYEAAVAILQLSCRQLSKNELFELLSLTGHGLGSTSVIADRALRDVVAKIRATKPELAERSLRPVHGGGRTPLAVGRSPHKPAGTPSREKKRRTLGTWVEKTPSKKS